MFAHLQDFNLKSAQVRLAFQSVLLAMLWEMSKPTVLGMQAYLGL